jgi:hypothetical protein
MKEVKPDFGQFSPVFTVVIVELLDYFNGILDDVGRVKKIKLRGIRQQATYTDRATAACR